MQIFCKYIQPTVLSMKKKANFQFIFITHCYIPLYLHIMGKKNTHNI